MKKCAIYKLTHLLASKTFFTLYLVIRSQKAFCDTKINSNLKATSPRHYLQNGY